MFTSSMIITIFHQVTHLSLLLHLRTVTIHDNCHTFPHPLTSSQWPSYLSINWNWFQTTFTPLWELSHLLTTVSPSHTPPPWPWPSHLSINWHSCLIPFTPPWWLSHFLKPSDTPHALLLLPMTITPPHQLTNLLRTVTLLDICHTFPHIPINHHTSLSTDTPL